jgi:hypothetical protein
MQPVAPHLYQVRRTDHARWLLKVVGGAIASLGGAGARDHG